jgi:hypothetical protein
LSALKLKITCSCALAGVAAVTMAMAMTAQIMVAQHPRKRPVIDVLPISVVVSVFMLSTPFLIGASQTWTFQSRAANLDSVDYGTYSNNVPSLLAPPISFIP